MGQHKPHRDKNTPHSQNGFGGAAGEPAAAWQGREPPGFPGWALGARSRFEVWFWSRMGRVLGK